MDCTPSMMALSMEVVQNTMLDLGLPQCSGPSLLDELREGIRQPNSLIRDEVWEWLGVNGRAAAYRLLRANQDLIAMVKFHHQRRQQDKLSDERKKPGSGYFDRACGYLDQVLKQSKYLHESCIVYAHHTT
jgi:hypothetical protein